MNYFDVEEIAERGQTIEYNKEGKFINECVILTNKECVIVESGSKIKHKDYIVVGYEETQIKNTNKKNIYILWNNV